MELHLAHGLTFADLYTEAALPRIDAAFVKTLPPELDTRLHAARADEAARSSDLILELAPYLDDFIAELFNIRAEVTALTAAHDALAPLWLVKRQFIQRRATKAFAPEEAQNFDGNNLWPDCDELDFATKVASWLNDEATYAEPLDRALRYAAWALLSPQGRSKHGNGNLFQLPKKLDPMHLVPLVQESNGCFKGPHIRDRQGFALTDHGTDLRGALDEANYCIWCHHQNKDSCSKGLKAKDGTFQKSAHGITLTGCPLEEKISEMHETKAKGLAIGALGIIAIDNPMCAATGHRICNDCMKACVFQKQEPVDIPQAETRTLKDVLALPWGFEIYSLLTRWNPLNFARPMAKTTTGYKVLVVGQGPSGFTLAHHLLNDGHAVFAIDGLKIEPLPQDILHTPVYNVESLREGLDSRTMAGFGGVAEYGITVRWDKNFLKLIRLLLERRAHYRLQGGTRLGSQITPEQAFELGFDHIALCIGAGRPTVIDMPGNLAKGVRQASDFLMALQLTGAAKQDSIANLQLRLPVVVIGGGLTAMDTATEARAYYPVQVEKFYQRYTKLVAELGGAQVRARWSAAEAEEANEFLAHAEALRHATPAQRHALIESWGGVTLAYRRKLTEAPSYTLNHEEVEKALEEGIHILEEATPLAVEVDAHNAATGLRISRPEGERTLPARTVLVAAGTQPNTVLARDGTTSLLTIAGKFLQTVDENNQPLSPEKSPKPQDVQIITSRISDGRAISTFGDLHPSFAGNVVKAMASAKRGYPIITQALHKLAVRTPAAPQLFAQLQDGFAATIVRVERLTPTIVDVVVKAPAAARQFQPGQFFRLQNFETIHGAGRSMEALALTGAAVNAERGEVSLIALEMGGASNLCAELQPGEPVVLMGPTGSATHIPENSTMLLIGGGLGNAVLFSIGQAARAKGTKVLYFAGYKKLADRYKVEEIEAAADQIIWCCDEAPGFTPTRPQDSTFVGNMLEALLAYGQGQLGTGLPLNSMAHLLCIGSDRLMGAVATARHTILQPYLKADHVAVGSINSPMQCMMKEICAQCLQRQVDPQTGAERIVFTCFNQDQLLDEVDFGCLATRLGQNSVSEKLTAQWQQLKVS